MKPAPAAVRSSSVAAARDRVQRELNGWFAARGWKALAFQKTVWRAIANGQSGLLHATTGAGKTYAVWLGALMAFAATAQSNRAQAATNKIANGAPATGRAGLPLPQPLTVLWITPMRALAADTLRALQQPLDFLNRPAVVDDDGVIAAAPGLNWSAGARSGDTASAERSAQNKRLPTVLVTTPESLSVLLSRADAREVLGSVRMVVVDEWHELLGNKRGVQVQLALARLQRWRAPNAEILRQAQDEWQSQGIEPGSDPHAVTSIGALCVWGLSATLGNLEEAMHTLLGHAGGTLVRGALPKKLVIDTLLPPRVERFPWGGHLGLTMLPQVIAQIDQSGSTLVFTNTRSQAELWYRALIEARPDWAGLLALHHGSLDRAVREWVEAGLKSGALKAVVCTSSLDLGVDFLPVERVLQIGSPKGVARLLQRAGRSGHAPGRPSRITLVPTHSLEIVEGVAARLAIAEGLIEARSSPEQPLDVLVQHLVTVALGGGFTESALYAEVRSTTAYAKLSPDHWQWALDFVRQGGASLAAYPDYRRAVPDAEGVWRVLDARLARRHRMNIGTIVSDASMSVQVVGGARIGSVEESFAARLKPGECFLFGGRLLELVRIHDMTAWVRRATGRRAAVPRWNGGRMPLSTTLADAVVRQLAQAAAGHFDSPELRCVRPLLALQQQWSALPTPDTLLAEVLITREGTHLFVYPFAGRPVHLGLANLIAWRVAQLAPRTFSIAVNDYGFELLSATAVDWAALLRLVLGTGGVEGEDRKDGTVAHGDAAGKEEALLHLRANGREVRAYGAYGGANDADFSADGADLSANHGSPEIFPVHPEVSKGPPDRPEPVEGPEVSKGLQAQPTLQDEVLASLNASELAQRRFREIARVSGLIFQGYPGEKRSSRQLQASSSLFYEVFRKYDPGNRLLLQAEQELLAQELEVGRLRASLERIASQRLVLQTLKRPTPFAFALMVERFREKLSSESVAERIARMVAQLEKAAGGPVAAPAADAVKGTLAFGQDSPVADTSPRGPRSPRGNRRERSSAQPGPLR